MSLQHTLENENKRKRLTQACELCRRKKIKCDGAKPGCGNCTRLSVNCTYSTNNKKRGPRQGYIEMLEQRLAKMEKILLSADKQNTADPLTEEYDQNQSSEQDNNSVGDHHLVSPNPLGSLPYPSSSSNNETLFSLKTPMVGTKRPSEDLSEAVASPKSFSSMTSSSLPSPQSHMLHASPVSREAKYDTLPSPAIIDHCIDLFFEYLYSSMPIFDKETIKSQITQRKRSDFFIFCFLAATARFSNAPDVAKNPPWSAGEKYADKARPLIIKVLDEPSISNTQALLLLAMHEYGCGRGPRSGMYNGMAMRMAMELGLHEELEDSEECCDSEMSKSWSQEYRRRLLWVLYSTDKISSAATGKPPSLSHVYCNVFLPSSDNFKMDQYYAENLDGSRYVMNNRSGLQDSQLLSASDAPTNEDNSLSRRSPLSAFAYFVRIIDLLGRVSTYVNSKRRDSSNFIPPCNPDSDFQQLDRAIDTWYDELPMHLKNTPTNLELSRSSSETNESRLFTIIHIAHNTLIVLLHRPSLVASDTLYSHLIQPSIKQFISNSVEKCTAAVDNVTMLLKEVSQRKECATPFMSYFVYTVATVVVSNSFSPRKEEAQKAKQALGVYFQFLLNARGLWAMADKLYFMIRDLYTIHSNILKQQQQQQRSKEMPAENASPLSSVRSSQQSLLQPFQSQESFSYPMQTLPLQQQQQQQQQAIDQLSSVNNSLADWTLPYYMNALAVPTTNSLENGDAFSLFQIPQAFNEPFLYNNNNNNSM